MATLSTITALKLSSLTIKPIETVPQITFYSIQFSIKPNLSNISSLRTAKKRRSWVIESVTEDKEVAPLKNKQSKHKDENFLGNESKDFKVTSSEKEEKGGEVDVNDRLMSRAINATIVLGAGTVAITRLLTIDHDYWHGWTLYEVLRYAPEHNWVAYEEALKANPVLAKMAISGIVYSLGDWIAQALFPSDDWWVVPAKVAFDQTIWAAVWNSIYYVVLGFLRLESPANISRELKATFWPMLTAGWKLWPFAHLITYGVIPLEQRLLWVDCVELIWVTILSTYSNEKSEARISEASSEANSGSSSSNLEE